MSAERKMRRKKTTADDGARKLIETAVVTAGGIMVDILMNHFKAVNKRETRIDEFVKLFAEKFGSIDRTSGKQTEWEIKFIEAYNKIGDE